MPRRIKTRSELKPPVGRRIQDLRRGSARKMGYDAAWDRVAKARRNADYNLCQACLAEDHLTIAFDVDHIIPMHVRPDWRLEFDNTQVLCRMHHSRKTHADTSRYGSSTATKLTSAQQEARRAAQQLADPPRPTPGGRSFLKAFFLRSGAVAAREFPRNWGEGVADEGS